MKYLGNLVVSGLILALGIVIWGIEITPLYGSEIMTIFLSALLSSLIGFVIGWTLLLGLLIPVGVGALIDSKAVMGCSAVVAVIVILGFSIFYIPHIMTTWVPARIDWFPQFTYWQYFLIGLLGTLVTVANTDTKKDKK